MRCLKGCQIKDDLDAMQLEDGAWLCGVHVDDLLGKVPQSNLDTIGRVKAHRNQPKMKSTFTGKFGAYFVPRKRA